MRPLSPRSHKPQAISLKSTRSLRSAGEAQWQAVRVVVGSERRDAGFVAREEPAKHGLDQKHGWQRIAPGRGGIR